MNRTKILSKLSVLFLCLFLVALIYGLGGITSLGLYSDDWAIVHLFWFDKILGFIPKINFLVANEPHMFYRVVQYVLYPFIGILSEWLDNSVLAIHLTSLIFNTLILFLLTVILKNFTKVNILLALAAALLVITMPGRSATFFWGVTLVESISILLMLCVFWLHFKSNINLTLSIALIVLCTLFSVWSYEVTVFIPLAFIPIYMHEESRKALMHGVGAFIGVLTAIIIKFYIHPIVLGYEQIKSIGGLSESPARWGAILADLMISLTNTINIESVLNYWKNAIENQELYMLLLVLLVALFVTLYRFTFGSLKGTVGYTNLLIMGIFLYLGPLLAYVPLFTNNMELSLYGKYSRFTSLSAMGLGLLIVYIILLFSNSLVRNSRKLIIPVLIFSILIVLNFLSLSAERNSYIKSWTLQKSILGNVSWGDLLSTNDVFVFVVDAPVSTDNSVPVFSDFWTLSISFSLQTNNKYVEADFAKNPYGKLDDKHGYKSTNWEEKYYTKDQLYMVNLKDSHPRVVPLFAQN